MGRLCWFIIDEEDPFESAREYVYVVRREQKNLEFIFKTKALALKCAERLTKMCPEEYGDITVQRKIVRTEYN